MRSLFVGLIAFAVLYVVMSGLLFLLGGAAGTLEVLIVFVVALVAAIFTAITIRGRMSQQ